MAFERMGGFFKNMRGLFRGQEKPFSGGEPNKTEPSMPQMPPNQPPVEESQVSDYESMLEDFGEHWGQSREGLENIMDKVSHHESKGKNVYQTGGGPGAGLFQYERGVGQGGETARNRLANWYKDKKMDTPDWLNQEGMGESGFDASKLSSEQQRMLFMADKRYDKTASLTKDATADLGNWWAKEHWRGGEEGSDVYNKRVSSFNRDLMVNSSNQPSDEVMNNVTTEQGSEAFTSY